MSKVFPRVQIDLASDQTYIADICFYWRHCHLFMLSEILVYGHWWDQWEVRQTQAEHWKKKPFHMWILVYQHFLPTGSLLSTRTPFIHALEKDTPGIPSLSRCPDVDWCSHHCRSTKEARASFFMSRTSLMRSSTPSFIILVTEKQI